jgi:hypothetical protein
MTLIFYTLKGIEPMNIQPNETTPLNNLNTIQQHTRNWLHKSLPQDRQYMAVTMRLVDCSDIDASNQLKHLLNRLNRTLLKSQYRNGRKKLMVLSVFEGSTEGRHLHLVIENPTTDIAFRLIFQEIWLKLRTWKNNKFRNEKPDIKQADAGWIDYITKIGSKRTAIDTARSGQTASDSCWYLGSFDWNNFDGAMQ